MSIYQAIQIIDILAWPCTVIVLVWLCRKQIRLLVSLVQRIKYKDLEVEFSERLAQVTSVVGEPMSSQPDPTYAMNQVYALVDISPASAVIEAWKELERAARAKVSQLVPIGESFRDPIGRPIDYLNYKGALIPSAASAARELRYLRNQAAHAGPSEISREAALQYARLANQIRSQIDAISELPSVKLTALTLLILELNHLIDSKKFENISIEEVYAWIDRETVIPSLKARTEGESDLSLFSESGPYSGFVAFYHEQLKQLAGGYACDHRRKWGVENMGLCLLLAWTNELVQQGAGWYPKET